MTGTSPAALLLEHAEFVRRLATQLAGADEGQDVAQDAWAKVLARPPRAVHDPLGWLRAVVTNTWRNRHRGERRQRAHAAAAAPGTAGAVPSAEQIAVREEVRRNVVAAVLALPEPLRDVVVLHFHEGLASPEIAERLGLSPSGVRTRMQQAMERLRQRLDGEYGGTRALWAVPLLHWRRHAAGAPAAAPFAIAAWLRMAAVLLVAATAALWFASRDPEPPALAGPATSAASAAPAIADERTTEPATATAERVALTAAAPSPHVYRGESPTGSLRGRVRAADDGAPSMDAVLQLRAIEPAGSAFGPVELPLPRPRQARTGSDGEYTFAGVPAGAYELEVTSAGGLRTWVRVAVAAREKNVDLWLRERPFAGNATVKVLDAGKRPVAGATVTLALHCSRRGPIGWHGVPAIRGATDALGTFRLQDEERLETVFEGLAFAQTADGRTGMTVIGRPEHRGDRTYWEVVVDAPGTLVARLSGLRDDALAAVQPSAEPMACYHHVWPGGPSFAFTRDADGSFRAQVPAGDHHVRADAPGARRLLDKPVGTWQSLPAVTVVPGAVVETTIAFGAGRVLRGRVQDEHGAGIAGAEVRALLASAGTALLVHTPRRPGPDAAYAAARTRTDGAGCYELALAPGRWHVVATATGHTMDAKCDVVAGDEPVALEHTLRPDGAVHGSTTSSLLAVRAVDTPALVHGILVGDSDGAFALRGLAPGVWEAGRFTDRSFVPITTFAVSAGQLTFLDLGNTGVADVRGIVQHAGAPVPELDVVCSENDARATTNSDGSFVIVVPAGAPTLRVEHRGVLLQRIPCPAPEGSRDLGTIALRAQRVHLRAVGADDRPEPATLWAENWDDDDARALRRFAADGRLVGQWLPTDPGVRCGFGARFADGSEHTVRVLRDEREVVVRRQPCGSLELRVVDPEGCARPAAMFRILPWGRDGEAPHDGAAFASARDRSSHGLFALTDADGRTIVHGIPPGPVLVYFTGDWGTFGHGPGCDGPPPVEQVIHVRRGETASADLVLPRF